jgi:hypothetical protein
MSAEGNKALTRRFNEEARNGHDVGNDLVRDAGTSNAGRR